MYLFSLYFIFFTKEYSLVATGSYWKGRKKKGRQSERKEGREGIKEGRVKKKCQYIDEEIHTKKEKRG